VEAVVVDWPERHAAQPGGMQAPSITKGRLRPACVTSLRTLTAKRASRRDSAAASASPAAASAPASQPEPTHQTVTAPVGAAHGGRRCERKGHTRGREAGQWLQQQGRWRSKAGKADFGCEGRRPTVDVSAQRSAQVLQPPHHAAGQLALCLGAALQGLPRGGACKAGRTAAAGWGWWLGQQPATRRIISISGTERECS
jgi:hypothetical protein